MTDINYLPMLNAAFIPAFSLIKNGCLMNHSTTRLLGIIALLTALFGSTNAYAYLDPGTGSMVLQALVAGILGSAFAIKMYWQRIVSFFKRSPDSSSIDSKK